MRFPKAVLAGLCLVVCPVTPALAVRVENMPVPAGSGVRSAGGSGQAFLPVAAEEAVVWFDQTISSAAKTAIVASLGGRILDENAALGWTHVALAPGSHVADALTVLRLNPAVKRAEANRVYSIVRTPNDPSFNSQFQFSHIDAPGGWEFEVGTSCLTTVAVIDAGIEATQPDLSAKLSGLTHQACLDACVADPATVTPGTPVAACQHGTEVAGMAAASTDNGTQVAGVSWGSKVLSMRVFATTDCNTDCSPSNSCVTTDTRMANALTYLAGIQNTATYGHIVANMSLGCLPGTLGCSACSVTLQPAVNAALTKGVVIVAAAGNDGPSGNTVNVPGNCTGVIPVGATDIVDNVASFSSRGPELASNGVVAPGDGVTSTTVGGTVAGGLRGTSFASPIVAGAAALMLSAKPTLTVNTTQNDVQTILRATADSIGTDSNSQGAGKINLFRALRYTTRGSLAGFDGQQKPIAFPNPFRISQSANVSIAIPPSLQGSGLSIKIFTQDGGLVREINSLVWDGKNAEGTLVASGTYVFVVKTSKGESRGRMAVIR